MSDCPDAGIVRMIPIDCIDVLNPRDRNNSVFNEIIKNIETVGLKKPITVTSRFKTGGSEHYLLICGEGRLKAFRALGESHIPALVIDVSEENAFIMSLAENIARRHHRPLELLVGIEQLLDRGYGKNEIAKKTGLSPEYVQGVLTLLKHGEERLLVAVEKGGIPLNVALAIVGAGNDDVAIQSALQDAYESGALRGNRLNHARRIIAHRSISGRKVSRNPEVRRTQELTSSGIIRTYQKEAERQKLLIKKSNITQQRLLIIVSALRKLFADENFVTLLRAEDLDSLPTYLDERIKVGAHSL
ncbi:MAG: ParB/RepB/Spo0J family partition protein [Gammaproteobacteria bacterium]|nr:ParB/RepB/Spo0J family partition protein [Gammaproteobacteria bacterium]